MYAIGSIMYVCMYIPPLRIRKEGVNPMGPGDPFPERCEKSRIIHPSASSCLLGCDGGDLLQEAVAGAGQRCTACESARREWCRLPTSKFLSDVIPEDWNSEGTSPKRRRRS